MAALIGIDLGTTFSAVATIDETGRPIIVHNGDGANVTPSCIQFREDGVAEVGELARRSLFLPNVHAVGRFKREMGTSTTYDARGQTFTPTDLSALVLKKLAADTSEAVGELGQVVVTIPANFSHDAREATMAAARAADLDVKYIVNEPTAAALYYAFKSGTDLHGVYAVYDLGGGTFDVSIIRVDGQDVEVLSTNGVARLGGDEFDRALQKLVQEKFKEQTGEDLNESDFTKNDAEDEKRALSKRDSVTFPVARALLEITRAEFEEAISSFLAQTEMMCEATLLESGSVLTDIQGVFLVGGSTRIPAVRDSVRRTFDQELISTANVDEVVALGAALYAAFKGDRSGLNAVQKASIERIKVSESTSQCFGTISLNHDAEREQYRTINSVLIRKGEKIPCSVTESFFTVADGQTAVDCRVTESVAPETDPRFVRTVWEGELELPPGRPAGEEIRVTFAYDANQVMKCSFVDVGTGREQRIDLSMVEAGSRSSSPIDRFVVE